MYPMASRSSKRLRTPAASATVAINGTAARSSTGVRAASKRGKQSGGRGRGRPPISHVPGFSQGMSSAYLHDFTTAMVGAASADTVLAAVKRLEPSDAEARKAGAELETIEGGFKSMDGLKVARYLDGLAGKLSLASSGSKANVLLAPNPWPRPPSEERLFTVQVAALATSVA